MHQENNFVFSTNDLHAIDQSFKRIEEKKHKPEQSTILVFFLNRKEKEKIILNKGLVIIMRRYTGIIKLS